MKKKGKRFRSIVCICLCFILIFGMAMETSASSKYYISKYGINVNVDLSGYKYYKGNKKSKYKATTYMKGKLEWVSLTKAKFSGTTGGKYNGTNTPDYIVQMDTIKASGIGSLSISGGGASVSTSSNSYTYTYEVSNKGSNKKYKEIECDVTYTASKGITFKVTVSCATKYTWGNYNLRVESGSAG